jgi:hypothetical protein
MIRRFVNAFGRPSASLPDDFRHLYISPCPRLGVSETFTLFLISSTLTEATMVASVPRKYEKVNHQYHLKGTVSKGLMVDDRQKWNSHSVTGTNATSLPPSCLPQRRYIVLPKKCASDASVISGISDFSKPTSGGALGVSQLLESFTYLCLGGEVSRVTSTSNTRRKDRRRASIPGNQSTRVVYPIASYPGRLNSKRLIEQRRQSLPHNFFRPVPSDI